MSFFIKRNIGGQFAPYNDVNNFLHISDFGYLDSANNEDMTKFSVIINGRQNTILEYCNVLKRHKNIICSNNMWFDTNIIESNKIISFSKKWGANISTFKHKKSIVSMFSDKTSFLLDEGYYIMENSDVSDGWHILYGNGDNIIRIQEDLRDNNYTMYINKNNY